MGQARERLDGQVAERFRTIDLQALSKRQKHEYESLRKVAKPVSIDCDASQRNSRLEENTRKATRATRRYARQSKQGRGRSPVRPTGLRRFTRTGRTRTVWPGISTRPGACSMRPRAWNWWFLICVLGFRTRWPCGADSGGFGRYGIHHVHVGGSDGSGTRKRRTMRQGTWPANAGGYAGHGTAPLEWASWSTSKILNHARLPDSSTAGTPDGRSDSSGGTATGW